KLQCCNDYHEYLSEPKINRTACIPQPPGWDTSSWGWCQNCNNSQQGESSVASVATLAPDYPPNPFVIAPPQHQHQHHHHHHHHPQPQQPLQDPTSFGILPDLPEKCMWNDCDASFATLSDLVGHVNLVHLRPSTRPPQQREVAPAPHLEEFDTNLSCLWNDCSTNVSPQNVAGPSNAPEISSTFSALETHLLRDHLGLDLAYLASVRKLKEEREKAVETQKQIQFEQPICDENIQGTPPPPTNDASSDIHHCQWKGCDAWFATCDDLTGHLNTTHVGSGKAHYECFWDNCHRNGEQGFSSKQKICRHLQSHTGHRPFQCQICQQNFSEAATLQQHMRRHTQEKPYACDFPGCGKSFAIMGALTIHKRIHNGLKPFKCKYCDKAFSESSNLSKHLRTHTGARPYSCPEPDCGKTFARPDQLNRHMGVHRKNTSNPAVPVQ
ncbi:hypothetical protein FA15DRAFT_556532, partial [Coprinopsis marcescibilis]